MFERLGEVKARKPFSPWDLILYVPLAALTVLLFVWFALPPRGKIEGIELCYREEVVYRYSFAEGGKAATGWEEKISLKEEGDYAVITLYLGNDGREFNQITVDLKGRTAKMTDSDCDGFAWRRECVASGEISTGKGIIVCMPHRLQVRAIGGEGRFDSPILG